MSRDYIWQEQLNEYYGGGEEAEFDATLEELVRLKGEKKLLQARLEEAPKDTALVNELAAIRNAIADLEGEMGMVDPASEGPDNDDEIPY